MSADYGGVATSEYGTPGVGQRLGAELTKLKRSIVEGTVELRTLGILGSLAMCAMAVLGFVGTLLDPLRALVTVYCLLGGLLLLGLEAIHSPNAMGGLLAQRIDRARIILDDQARILTTLTGRALCYGFFGSLMLANETVLIAKAVGAFVCFVGVAMLFVAVRSSAKLSALGDGLTEAELVAAFDAHDLDHDGKLARAELASLCSELGTTLTVRELEAALALLDVDHTGLIDKNEFVAWWAGRSWQRRFLAPADTQVQMT